MPVSRSLTPAPSPPPGDDGPGPAASRPAEAGPTVTVRLRFGATGVPTDSPGPLYGVPAAASPLCAYGWRRSRNRGPLGHPLAAAAGRARTATTPPVLDPHHQSNRNKERTW